MRTAQDKLKFVMEAAGECYHEVSEDKKIFKDTTGQFRIRYCVNCGKSWDKCVNKNPPPDDMNKLMELAEKLGYRYKIIKYTDGVYCGLVKGADQIELASWTASQYDTPQEALLNALYSAAGGS